MTAQTIPKFRQPISTRKKKLIFPNIYSEKIFTLAFLLFYFFSSNAQTDIVMGTGTTGNPPTGYPCPLQDYYESSIGQYLYLASELTAAGMSAGKIDAIKFNVLAANTGAFRTVERLTIKIGHTTLSSLGTSSSTSALLTVWGGPQGGYLPTAGIAKFQFYSNTPFMWNGTDNIIVQTCSGYEENSYYIWNSSNPVVTWTTGLPFNASQTFAGDNWGYMCGSSSTTLSGWTSTSRPNIVFSWTSNTPCNGAPVAGAVNAPSDVCLNKTFVLALNGATTASVGLTYNWQKICKQYKLVRY